VKQNEDGTYEMKVSGLNEGLNLIHIAPMDKVGNLGKDQVILVNKTSNHVWIDLNSATLGDNVPSNYWTANVKPGDQFNLNFKAVGRKNVVKKIQAVILKNYYDNNTVVGDSIDLDLTQFMTEKPAFGVYSEYSVKGHVTIPTDLPAGEYAVKFVCLGEGEKWNDPEIPAIGIETFVDTIAPNISLNASNMKAYVENSGDPVSLMLNSTVKDAVNNSRGYKVEVAVDGGPVKSIGSITTADKTPQTFRYPVVLAIGDHSIVLTATDYMGNESTITFDVTVAADKVTVKKDGTNTDLPVNVVPFKDASRNAEIKLLDNPRNGVYVAEQVDPGVTGYLVSPYGNNKTFSSNPDLAPILLVGNQQRIATTYYNPNAVPSWNLPLGDVYTFNSNVGYDDPGSIPEGDSTFPVTMIDYLGHEITIQVPVHKNSYIPKVKFDDAIIDSTGTATFFTYDSTYIVKGSITAVKDKFYATWVNWNGPYKLKNLFDENSEWRDSPYDNPLGSQDIPAGYEKEPGVNQFSMSSGELKPGPNYFEIDGGSTTGANPGHPLAGNHPLVSNVVIYRLGAAESADQPLATIAANNLTWDMLKGENADQAHVRTNLALPFVDEANKAYISWGSSDTTVISNDGRVNRPEKDTNITLTATATVGGATAVKTFNVTVDAKNQEDSLAVDEDSSFVTWNIIRAGNINQGDVSQALSLPTIGSNGSKITWTSDDTKHITNQGRVYPPLFDEGDAHVELVAKITRNSGIQYKTFNLTVLKDSINADKTKVLRAYQSLDIQSLLGENSAEYVITHDLSLPTSFGKDGVTITWLSNSPEVIANDGKVTRPAQNQAVGLTAIFRLGTTGIAKSYSFYVRRQDTSDEPAVLAAKSSVVWNLIKQNNTDQNSVKTNLNLPIKGTNDTTISWSSSNPSFIKEDGTVKRPSFEIGNRPVTLTATITKGNASATREFEMTVLRQPLTIINTIDDNDKSISGITEANANVIVKNKELVVGTGKANADGKYAININPQKAGTVLTIYVQGLSGSQSKSTIVLDRTAPNAPKINPIDDNDTSISGTTEANTSITISAQNKVIATGKADTKGAYRIQIAKQKAGTVLTVNAKDAAGNQSVASKITVLDRTAPNAPVIYTIDDNDTTISGKTEANAAIYIKNQNKIIATGKADTKGAYRIKVSKQKAGTVLTVNAKDAAGNQSTTSKTTVLDRTAPKAPAISSLIVSAKNGVDIKGKAEPNATIVVTISNKVVAKVKVSSNGTFVLKLPKQRKGTLNINLYAVDKAGNKSNSVSRTIKIK
jgi:hypothetical protein